MKVSELIEWLAKRDPSDEIIYVEGCRENIPHTDEIWVTVYPPDVDEDEEGE